MQLKVKVSPMDGHTAMAVLNAKDCVKLGLGENDRVRLQSPLPILLTAARTDTLTPPGTILLSRSALERSGLKEGRTVKVCYASPPRSMAMVRRSMAGLSVGPEGIAEIVADAHEGNLSKLEISAWLSAVHIRGLGMDEMQQLARSMTDTGCSLNFNRRPVFDFHSVGGLPGNKVTPVVVSIVAAAGLMLPKTSSRAISSACGTSDFVEVFCDVSLSGSRLMDIAERTGGVFAWGGAMNITPVSQRFIDVQYSLEIDPRSMMMASIMSKKLAMGAEHLIMDLPTGPRTKVRSMEEAQSYARDFIELGRRLGIEVECAITDGRQPLGHAIGPALEARECIQTLELHPGTCTVREKSCELAGMILEMGGVRNGYHEALRLMKDGSALEKFQEIAHAQDGEEGLTSEHITLGSHSCTLDAPRSGYVLDIHNKKLVSVVRAAGAPADKGGGIILRRKLGERVEEGEPLLELFSENEAKLNRACDMVKRLDPILVGGMVMERASPLRRF